MRDRAVVRVRRLRVGHSSHDLDCGILGRKLKGKEENQIIKRTSLNTERRCINITCLSSNS